MISECCGAPVYGEVLGTGRDAVGICGRCKEWMPCYNEDEENEEN